MTATLKPVKPAAKGHNRYCGPAALSIIAGVDTAEAAAIIRRVSRKRSVTGTSHGEILRSLALLGFKATSAAKVNPLDRKNNPTLAAWLGSADRDGTSLYLVAAGYHWQVVQGRRFCCGVTQSIVSLKDKQVKRRARLTGVWKIEAGRKVPVATLLAPKAPRDTSEATARRKTIQLGGRLVLDVEVDRVGGFTTIYVWAPRFKDEADDPFEGDHIAESWADALRRAETYAALITAQPELLQ